MATKADLRTRLQRRLGLGVVSAVEQERLGEALNSGIARALSDGVPGLAHDVFIGMPLPEFGLTSATAAAGSSTITLVLDSGSLNAQPHDILVVDVAGTETKFLIRKQTAALTVDVGIPATAALSGGTASKLIQRSLRLPSSGQISSVYRVGSAANAQRLSIEPNRAHRDPFETGAPAYYEQRYDDYNNTSFISLWPAPNNTSDQFAVVQAGFLTRLDSDSDTLSFPEEALDAILERSRMAYITWTGAADSVEYSAAIRSVEDTSDSLKNSSNAQQIFYKT